VKGAWTEREREREREREVETGESQLEQSPSILGKIEEAYRRQDRQLEQKKSKRVAKSVILHPLFEKKCRLTDSWKTLISELHVTF